MITKSRLYATRIKIRRPKRNNPSKERDELMRRSGVALHTVSAYLIFLKGIKETL